MKESEKKGESPPACGYGLLGLCCSSCLLGPCRISPFEESRKGLCGDDRDLLVAKNLLRLTLFEAMEEMGRSREVLRQSIASVSAQPPKGKSSREMVKVLSEKYGYSSALPRKKLAHFLTEASGKMLSFFPGDLSSVARTLYPEKVFPRLDQRYFPTESLMSLLLDSRNIFNGKITSAEEILHRCLQISLGMMVSRELRMDMNHLIGGQEVKDSGNDSRAVLNQLSPNSFPVLLLLSEDESPAGEKIDELEKDLKGAVSFTRMREIGGLADVGKRILQERALSASEWIAMTVVFSKSVTDILGLIALGLNTASLPPLPIHGSEKVERFFCQDLKNRFGHTYLIPDQEGLSSAILRFLGRGI